MIRATCLLSINDEIIKQANSTASAALLMAIVSPAEQNTGRELDVPYLHYE